MRFLYLSECSVLIHTNSFLRQTRSILPFLSFRQKFCYCCSRTTITSDEPDGKRINLCFVDVNEVISKYLSWSFRTSYFLLFTVFASFYFSWILVFALVFYGISIGNPNCITSNGIPIGEGEGARLFGDCFHLSWTTFSTVGYGLIHPATKYVHTQCLGTGIIGSFEAFLGILYAGFCGEYSALHLTHAHFLASH